MTTTTRPTWDATWMDVARKIAERSLCVRDQVCAIIVSPTNRMVSSGYNGPPAGFPHEDRRCDTWCPRARATFEWVATEGADPIDVVQSPDGLRDAKTQRVIDDPYLFYTQHGYVKIENVSPCYDDCLSVHAETNAIAVCDRTHREGGTLYVTSHVCFTCAKLIANSGLAVVVRPADTELEATHRHPDRSYEFLESCGIEVYTV